MQPSECPSDKNTNYVRPKTAESSCSLLQWNRKKAKMRQYRFLHNTGVVTSNSFSLQSLSCMMQKILLFLYKIYDHLLCSAFSLIEFYQRCQQPDTLRSNDLWQREVDCGIRGDNMQICRGLAGQMGRNRRKGGRFQSSPKAALPPFVLFQQQPAANIFLQKLCPFRPKRGGGHLFCKHM